MKTIRVSQTLYDYSGLEETECALALSPCPQPVAADARAEGAQSAHARGGPQRDARVQSLRRYAADEHDWTETLSLGWAIALAVAVATVVYVSGG